MPRHGEERNRRLVRIEGPHQEYRLADDPSVIYTMPLWVKEHTESERWCEHCQKWQPQKGILATLFGCPECKTEWYGREKPR